jgi:hypothetical protein
MQMRKIWGVMLDPDFDPRAISESRPMKFKKSMEAAGLSMPADKEEATKALPPRRSRQNLG